MKVKEAIFYGDDSERQVLDLYLPDEIASAVFVYFHGGGLEAGDKKDAAYFAPYLTERGVAVASANYQLYPNAKYPDFIWDAAKVVAWVNECMRRELNCDQIYVGGSSAGGYLTMMLCFDHRYLDGVGVDPSAVSGYFHDAGQPTAHFNVLKYAGVDPKRIIVDETAPLYYVGLEKSYPPMRFIVSDHDMQGRFEQTMLMQASLSHFGYKNYDCRVINGTHCAYVHKMDEHGESVFGKMIMDFILKNNLKCNGEKTDHELDTKM